MKLKLRILRLVSAILAIVMLIPHMAFAADIRISVLHEYFDNYPTNSVPNSIFVDGSKNIRVVEDEDKNKSVYIPTGYIPSVVTIPVIQQTHSTFVASVDLKYTEALGSLSLSFVSNSFKFQPVVITADGSLTTADGKVIGALTKDNYTTISVLVNTYTKVYSVYVNYQIVAANWRYTEKLDGITAISVETGVADAEYPDNAAVYLDTVRVYNRSSVSKCFAKKPYNNKVDDFVEDDSEKIISTDVFYSNNFEDANTRMDKMSFGNSDESNTVEFATDGEGESSNTYLNVKKTGAALNVQITASAEANYVVIENDIRVDEPGLNSSVFMMRDTESGVNFTTATVATDGTLKLSDGTAVTKMIKNKWYKLAVMINIPRKTFDAYLDGALVKKDIPFINTFKKINQIRLYLPSGTGDIKMDNVNIYGGKEPRDISTEDVSLVSSFKSDNWAATQLAGKKAIAPYTDLYFDGKEKKSSENEFICYDDEYLIPSDIFEIVFGAKVDVKESGVVIDDNIRLTFDSKIIKIGTREIEIPYSARKIDEVAYIPLYGYANNATNKIVSESTIGGIIISDKALSYSDADRLEIDYYLTNYRPSAIEIKEDFISNNSAGQHPRVWKNAQGFADLNVLKDNNATAKAFYDKIIKKADEILAGPISPVGDTYNFTTNTLSTGPFMNAVRNLTIEAQHLGLAYNMTGKDEYAAKLRDKLMYCIDHAPEGFTRESHLELSETGLPFGIAYDWIYHFLTPEERQKISQWTMDHVLLTLRRGYYSDGIGIYWWNRTTLNWNSVINNAVICMALAFADEYPEICFDAIEKSLICMESSLGGWAPNGGWYEGAGYANYAMTFLGHGLSAMRSCLGTMYRKEQARGVQDGTLYQYYSASMSGGVNNVGDGNAGQAASPSLVFVDIYNSKNLAGAIKKWHTLKGTEFGSFRDFLYYRPELVDDANECELEIDKFFYGRESQMVVSREGYGSDDMAYASWSGGYTAGGHNQADNGAFVYDVNGYRFISDLGASVYGAKGNTWDYFRKRAEAHSVMLINPDKTGASGIPGQDVDGYANVLYMKSGEGGVVSAIDLKDMYKEQVNSYIRGYMTADNRRTLTVRDEIVLKNTNSELYWCAMTQGDITIVDENTAYITREGEMIRLDFETNAESAKLYRTEADYFDWSVKMPDDGYQDNSNYSRLVIEMKASGRFNITVKLTPMGDGIEYSGIPSGKIESWTPPAKTEIPKIVDNSDNYALSSIYVDGEEIKGFSSNDQTYEVLLMDKNHIPKITATSANGENVTIADGKDITEPTIITLTTDESKAEKYYVVSYRIFKGYEPVEGRERYKVDTYEVSSVPNANYPGSGIADGMMVTKWVAEGKGEWAVQDMGISQTVGAIGLAFDYAKERIYDFEILVSEDGVNYTSVYRGTTEGNDTSDIYVYEIEPVKARYVKYVNHGNSVNVTTNIKEFAILK